MAARIEQLEQRLAAMAGTGTSSSTFHEGEDFPYLASAAQAAAAWMEYLPLPDQPLIGRVQPEVCVWWTTGAVYFACDMEMDLIRSRTLELLEAGLMELSHGEYASAIVMPAKKDVHDNYTNRRMCGDYRPINWQTKAKNDMERDLIRSRTLELLEVGLMELSHGEYASAIVMPTKKDVHDNYTDMRMCGDYRPINWQTKAKKYAMPTPE
ncbi:hypothetical protein AXG93_2584s1280 [Marchantia polymorpha subsp. ruderalis]|uniref:Uncharacterized protein n=1 Tax=Marchantia polymorpha subsp. ruderalis TaxID=1480154 RepID=A0A176VGL9_MARPO|nr:hypothetical protein AXG93_2584s1280 [Marchantia polymorpha subsp. ruderalis]